jgi:hypothetical protein
LCRKGNAEAALQRLRAITERLKLKVNEEKTRLCRVPEGEFDFLGYTFGRMYSAKTGLARLGYLPSKKSIKRMVAKVHAMTVRSMTWQDTTELLASCPSPQPALARPSRQRLRLRAPCTSCQSQRIWGRSPASPPRPEIPDGHVPVGRDSERTICDTERRGKSHWSDASL